MSYLSVQEENIWKNYEPTKEEIDSVWRELNNWIKEYNEKLVRVCSWHKEDNPLIINSNKFWKLDFSKSEKEFVEKNMNFFENLEDILNMRLIKDADWYINHFSLLYYIDKWWEEHVIPTPVFFEIIWDDSIYSKEYNSDDNFYKQDEKYEWEYKKYFMQKFDIKLDDSICRINIQDSNKEFYTAIREMYKNNYEEFLKLDDDALEKYIKFHYYNIFDVSIFDIGLSEKFIIEYSLENNISNFFTLENSEEKLKEDMKEVLSSLTFDKLLIIINNDFLPGWVKIIINNEILERNN